MLPDKDHLTGKRGIVMPSFWSGVQMVWGLLHASLLRQRFRWRSLTSLHDTRLLDQGRQEADLMVNRKANDSKLFKAPKSFKRVMGKPATMIEKLKAQGIKVSGAYAESAEAVPAPYPDASNPAALKESIQFAREMRKTAKAG